MNSKQKRKLEKEFNRHLQKRLRRYTYQRIEERGKSSSPLIIRATLEKANEITGKQEWYKEQNKEVQKIWKNVVVIVWENVKAELAKEGYKNVKFSTGSNTDHEIIMMRLRGDINALLNRLTNLPNR